MIFLKKKISILTLLAVFISLPLFSASSFAAPSVAKLIEKGDEIYAERAEGHSGDWADPAVVEKAIESYEAAYDAGERGSELIVKIMQANYFYATYAEQDKKKQMAAFKRSIELGEAALKKDPDNVALNYQMSGAWGRWAEVFGIIASARKGVADIMKDYAEKTVELDDTFSNAGGYRALGRLHFKSPRIPLLLPWPDNDESLKFLLRSVKIGPKNLTNHLFYADTLYSEKQYKVALTQVDEVINATPKPEKLVEELRDQREAKELKAKIMKKL